MLDGTTSALILYRSTTPLGDSKLTKLAVMPLAARDPAFEAVKANDMAAVKALLENRLGFHAAAEAPEKKAAPKKASPARPRSVTKAMPRTARTAPKSKTRKTQRPRPASPRQTFLKDWSTCQRRSAAVIATGFTTLHRRGAC